MELAEQRRRAEAAEAQLASIRQTLSFGLGHAIVEARTWRGLRRLPARILALRRRQRAKRLSGAPVETEDAGGAMSFVVATRTRVAAQGVEAARGWLRRKPGDRAGKARAMVELAIDQASSDPAAALSLGEEALAMNPRESRLWALTDALYAAGRVIGPATLAARITAPVPSEAYRRLSAALDRDARLLAHPDAPAGGTRPTIRGAGPVAIVTPRSAPFHEDAAAIRADEVARAATAAGREAIIITPPGYPAARDRPLRLAQGESGTAIVRLPIAKAGEAGLIDAYRSAFAAARARLVHLVAGDRDADRAAARAAADLHIPLIVDIGEVDRWVAAGDDGERSRAATVDLARLAAGASVVLARSARAAEMLGGAGANARLLPIVASPVLLSHRRTVDDLREELAIADDVRVIGCIVPLEPDPCFVSLIDAVPSGSVLLLVGAGPARPALEHHVVRGGIADRVRFTGPLLPGEIVPLVALCDAIVLPREDEAAIAADGGGVVPIALSLGTPIVATAAEAAWQGDGVTDAEIERLEPGAWADLFRSRPRRTPPAAGETVAGFYASL